MCSWVEIPSPNTCFIFHFGYLLRRGHVHISPSMISSSDDGQYQWISHISHDFFVIATDTCRIPAKHKRFFWICSDIAVDKIICNKCFCNARPWILHDISTNRHWSFIWLLWQCFHFFFLASISARCSLNSTLHTKWLCRTLHFQIVQSMVNVIRDLIWWLGGGSRRGPG